MTINRHKVNAKIAVYDGCHKIFIPADGKKQEERFIKYMEAKGWEWDKDFYKIDANSIKDMYIDSCGLRFIHQLNIDDTHNLDISLESGVNYVEIIPQCEFVIGNDDDCYFDETAAAKAFAA